MPKDEARSAGKFIQIAVASATVSVHDCLIFALDEHGTVWHYEGSDRGWEPFTDNRAMALKGDHNVEQSGTATRRKD